MALLTEGLLSEIGALDPEIEPIDLEDVRVRSSKRGCFGFFTKPSTGKYAYVCTLRPVGAKRGTCIVREASSDLGPKGSKAKWMKEGDVAAEVVRILS